MGGSVVCTGDCARLAVGVEDGHHFHVRTVDPGEGVGGCAGRRRGGGASRRDVELSCHGGESAESGVLDPFGLAVDVHP